MGRTPGAGGRLRNIARRRRHHHVCYDSPHVFAGIHRARVDGPATTAPPPASTVPPTVTTTEPDVPGLILAGGAVTGPEELRVTLGEEARWEVASDVAQELHVHGYDLVFELAPGEITEVRFVADVPGIFEVETHPGHERVVNLVVEP